MCSSVPLVFYGSAIYGMFCFGVLARKWPMLMQRWESVEAILPKNRDPNDKYKLARQIKRLAIVVLTCSLGIIEAP